MVGNIEQEAPKSIQEDEKVAHHLRTPSLDSSDSQGTVATFLSNDEIDHSTREIAYNDDMVTIREEYNYDSNRGADVLQDDACETAEPQEQAPNPSKRKVRWGSVLVRDYPMILGDNPCCSCGPPVTLDWEYEEHAPLGVDAYECHHPFRRTLRELGRGYYQRKHLLSLAGFTEEDFKRAEREASRAKLRRSIARSMAVVYPLFKAADAVESAGRKIKRLLKDDHWKAQKSLYTAA